MIRTETQGAVDVLQVDGTLNAEKAEELVTTLQPIVTTGAPMVVLDLSHVQVIDSDGLESLLDSADLVSKYGGTIKLAAPTPLVSDILRLSGVGKRFEIFSNTKTGVGSFAR